MSTRIPFRLKIALAASFTAATIACADAQITVTVPWVRAISGADLPAGQTIAPKPGGYHVMLTALRQPISDGGVVSSTIASIGVNSSNFRCRWNHS